MSGTSSGATNGIKIETYWNVNNIGTVEDNIMKAIKIETYWNVNIAMQLWNKYRNHIKIETYWNVNYKLWQIEESSKLD